MKSIYIKLLFVMLSGNFITMKAQMLDTISGYFIFYSSRTTNADQIKTHSVLLSLTSDTLINATDSFNLLISDRTKLLSYLNTAPKIHVDVDDFDMRYLIKKFKLNCKQDEKTFEHFVFLNRKQEQYFLNRYEAKNNNTLVSLVLFKANLKVISIDKDFQNKDCAVYEIVEDLCLPKYIYNDGCKGNVLLEMKIIGN